MNDLWKFFIAGITLGNGPCLFTCLPIILPYIIAGGSNWKSGLKISVIFSISRLLAYAVLGALSVLAFKLINTALNQYSGYIKLAMGLIIIVIGILYLLGKEMNFLCNILHRKFVEKTGLNAAIIGFLAGLAPCLPFAGVLTYIAATGKTFISGFLYGLVFGIGTVVSFIIPISMLGGLISEQARKLPGVFVFLRIASGLILIFFGIQLILKSL